jgi:hypothetical protein
MEQKKFGDEVIDFLGHGLDEEVDIAFEKLITRLWGEEAKKLDEENRDLLKAVFTEGYNGGLVLSMNLLKFYKEKGQ